MRETLGVLLGFFLAAVLGYLISEIAQKEHAFALDIFSGTIS